MKLFKREIYIIGNRPQPDWIRLFIFTVLLVVFVSIYNSLFYKGIEADNSMTNEEIGAISIGSGGGSGVPTVAPGAAINSSLNLSANVADKTDVNYIVDLYRTKNIKYLRALADFGH